MSATMVSISAPVHTGAIQWLVTRGVAATGS